MTFDELIAQQTAQRASLDALLDAKATEMQRILDAAAAENKRNLTTAEDARVLTLVGERAALRSQAETLDTQITALRADQAADQRATERAQTSHLTPIGRELLDHLGSGEQRTAADAWVYAGTEERAALRPGEQLREHPAFARIQAKRHGEDHMLDRYSGLGQMIRTISTSGTTANVPTLWASDFIDLARNTAAVGKAGASIIPMEAKQVNIARITGDATAAFRDEGGTITASDPTLDQVQLIAKNLSAYVKVTREWMQDADDAESVIVNALAAAMGLKIDEVALYGGIITGDASGKNLPTPPNPRGVLAALNAVLPANVLGNATNGTVQTAGAFWGEILDAVYQVRNSNEVPNALIWAIKAEQQYAKATDTTGQPLNVPPSLSDIARYATKQIPSYTKGTMASRATDVFVGDWSQLLIGERLDLTIEINRELFAESGHLAIFAHWRGDVQPARPAAFAAYRAIQGAA